MRLDSPWIAAAILGVTSCLLVGVALRLRAHRKLLPVVLSLVVGMLVSYLATWLVCDVFALIPVDVPLLARMWFISGVSLVVAAVALACTPARAHTATSETHEGGHRHRIARTLAALSSLVLIMGTVLGINSVFGIVRTTTQLNSMMHTEPDAEVTPLATPSGEHAIAEAEWTPPADMPSEGKLMHVDIPGEKSGFHARNATVWLPPAAQLVNPPALPVVLLLSGQPGSPDDVVSGGGDAVSILEQLQSEHHGLAPIVVSPDQLGDVNANPMCVDGALGNSRSYLEHDVIPWIRQHLPVAQDRLAWTFAGFSQGGTCTLQIGLDLPKVFASNIAISPEVAPTLDAGQTAAVNQGFGGDWNAWEAAKPASVMARHTAYSDTTLVIGTGELDKVFTGYGDQLVVNAKDAGITASRITSPGTSHDFNTVHYVFQHTLPDTLTRAGVTS